MTEPLEVLIIGAGPTGLTLALSLMRTQYPPRIRIVDKAPAPAQQSRALVIQSRSLELLEQYSVPSTSTDVISTLLTHGLEGAGMNTYVRQRRTLSIDMSLARYSGTKYPLPLLVSQADTELVLAEAVESYGIIIERGVTVEDLEQSENDCRAVLEKDGKKEEVTAKYVVGCDGAHSIVRHKAGLTFHGGAYGQAFILCDAYIDWPTPEDEEANKRRVLTTWGDRLLTVIPMKDNLVRLISIKETTPATPGAHGPMQAEPPKVSDFQPLLEANLKPGAKIRDPVWLSAFRLHHRGVDKYRAGRMFVAGDAAHIHSPVGGQGMNTGIQDATNLGWKLALVLHRERQNGSSDAKDQALLDSYNNERQPVGEKLLGRTDRLFEYAASDHWIVRTLRPFFFRFLFPFIMKIPARRVVALRFFTQLGVRYRLSNIVGTAKSISQKAPIRGGWRAPDAKVTADSGEEVWFINHAGMSGKHFLAIFAGASGDSPGTTALIETATKAFSDAGENLDACVVTTSEASAVRKAAGAAGLKTYVEASGELHRLFGLDKHPGYALMRPDGYVAHIGLLGDREELAGWLKEYPVLAA